MEIDGDLVGRRREDSPNLYSSDLETTQINSSAPQTVQTMQQKINRAKRRIQDEQRRRDENVEEYLKMAAVAQRNQLPQVKAVFEKRNTKAATHIAGLQRKLERYQLELQEVEKESQESHTSPAKSGVSPKSGGDRLGSEASGSSAASSHRTSKGRLQNVGHGIKTVISKPKEIASYYLKQKFGSADNITQAITRDNDGTHSAGHYHGSANIPGGETRRYYPIPIPTVTSGGSGGLQTKPMGQIAGAAEEEAPVSECSESAQSSSLGNENKITPNQSEFALVLQQLNEFKEDMCSMREDFENFKNQAGTENGFICQGLQEERFRAERLEEQVNDLTELHQAETGNLKQALADAEEKLSYQSEERLRDLAEMLEACQTKISRLEQQQQQLVTIEGIENSAARALAVKLVNVGLTMLQLLLLLVATVASALAPFLGSRIRLLTSILLGLGAFVAHRKWPQAQEAILQFWTELLDRL